MSWEEDFPEWFGRRWRSHLFGSRFFSEFDKMMEEMLREIVGTVPKDLYRERKRPDGSVVREMGPFVYGYSMTVGPDGKPVIREFGNVKPSRKPGAFGFARPGLEVKEEREPLVDTVVEDDIVKVVAELPGVEKSDIKLECTENSLVISVDTERRKYRKELNLPVEVDPSSSKASYKNGVLEVALNRVKRKPRGQSIRIE